MVVSSENNKNRIGFWVNGKFSWIDDEWTVKTNYKKIVGLGGLEPPTS